MKHNFQFRIYVTLLAVTILITMFPLMGISVGASTIGITSEGLKYRIENDEVSITGCANYISDINIPDKIEGYPVTKISDSAFYKCQSKSVVIPSSVRRIGDHAFASSTMLKSVIIPEGVSYIGPSAFYYCVGLESIVIPTSVQSIGDEAFKYCQNLASVYFYSSSAEVGSWAFQYCDNLSGVYIDDINSWCSITFYNGDSNPLSYAKNLYIDKVLVKEVVIPVEVSIIKEYTFRSCENITSIVVSEGISSIGHMAFTGCINLENVVLPESLTHIGFWAFSGCSSLLTVKIPLGVTTIGNYTFSNCTKLSNIDIPNSIMNINPGAFDDCKSLDSIYVPKSLTEIGIDAFSGCINLATVYYEGTETEWNSISIGDRNHCLTSANIVFESIMPSTIIGDINDDGVVNAKDVNALMRVIACAELIEEESDVFKVADLTKDGTLNAKDANLLKRVIAGDLQF